MKTSSAIEMRSLKIIWFCLLFGSVNKIYALGGYLTWPVKEENRSVFKGVLNTAISVKKNTSTFAEASGQAALAQVHNLNQAFITGVKKKEQVNGLEAVLQWDMKVKLRLNRNMNIIFTYN